MDASPPDTAETPRSAQAGTLAWPAWPGCPRATGRVEVAALQVDFECGDAQGKRHSLPSQEFFTRLLKAVLVAVALEAGGCAGDAPV